MVQDHLRSTLEIILGLGIICGQGSFAALYSFFFCKTGVENQGQVSQLLGLSYFSYVLVF